MAHTSKVSSISVEQIVNYCTCPLKVSQKIKGDDRLTPHDLFILSSKEAVYTYFNAIAQGYYTPTAVAKAVREFDTIWFDHKDLLIYDGRLSQYSGKLLIERISTIYNPKEDEVVATKFPIEVSLTSSLLLTDQIDILLINKKTGRGGKQTIRGISLVDVNSNDNQRYVDLRAGTFKMAIQSYLGPQTRRYYSYEIRPFTTPDVVIVPKLYQRHSITRLATNVMKGIKHNVWYPTTSKETCKQCHLKKQCNFSLLDH